MEKLTSEFRCENEFVVPVKKRGAVQTHAIAVFGDADLITDCLTDDDGKIIKETRATTYARQEIEYNSLGKPILNREILPGTMGTRTVRTTVQTPTKKETVAVETRDGKLVSVNERVYNMGGKLQSESDSYYNPDGTPSLTMLNYIDMQGRITRRDQILWHGDDRPAITETTQFDQIGCVSVYIKTVHNIAGNAVWEERTHFPRSSAKPSKKELTMFNSRHDKTFVDVVEYAADGTEGRHVVQMLAPNATPSSASENN